MGLNGIQDRFVQFMAFADLYKGITDSVQDEQIRIIQS